MHVLMFGLMILSSFIQLEAPAVMEGQVTCEEGGPWEDIVVFLESDSLERPRPLSAPATMDQRNLRFVPHVLAITVGTTVRFPNSDYVRHNVFSASEPKLFNLGTYQPGVSPELVFDQPGIVELLCNVHPEMSAFVVVLNTPFYDKTDVDGRFRIVVFPPGDYVLKLWCEHKGVFSRNIHLAGGQTAAVQAVLHRDEIRVAGRLLKSGD